MVKVDEETVVSLCDQSGIMVRPWVEAGYRAVCVDSALPAGEALRDGVLWIGADVRTWRGVRGRPRAVFGFPPCTDLANVGAGAWERKGEGALAEALAIADACLRIAVRSRSLAWMVENPVGRLTHYWGPPDHVFSPCDYGGYLLPSGDAYTKRTCLWVGGDFEMPPVRAVEPVEGSLVAEVSCARRRSETPRGFARAVFETLHAGDALRAGNLFHSSEALRAWDPLRAPESLRPGHALQPAERLPCCWCGREFKRGRRDQRYCGMRCRVAACRSRAGDAAAIRQISPGAEV